MACSSCGIEGVNGVCSMCQGDPGANTDGLYLAWMQQQEDDEHLLKMQEAWNDEEPAPVASAPADVPAVLSVEEDDDDYIPGDDDADGWIDKSDVGWDADGRMITADLDADKLIEVLREMNQPDDMDWDNSYPFGVYAPLEQAGYVEYHQSNERFELTHAARDYLALVDAQAAPASAPDDDNLSKKQWRVEGTTVTRNPSENFPLTNSDSAHQLCAYLNGLVWDRLRLHKLRKTLPPTD